MKLGPETSVLVTGGASGLGAATASRLAATGAKVVALDRTTRDSNSTLTTVEGDITDPDAVARAIDTACSSAPLRAVVACAGIVGSPTRTVQRDGRPHDLEDWQQIVAVNLVGTYNTMRLCAARMATQEEAVSGERGVLVMTASCAAFDGQTGQTAYAAAKAGVVGLTLPLARDLKPVKIRVNTIAPGVFETPMLNPVGSDLDPSTVERRNASLYGDLLFPARVGRADEYAALVEHLINNEYFNGETVRLDGGLRLSSR